MKFVKRSLRSAALGLLGLMAFLTYTKQGQVRALKENMTVLESRISRSKNTGQVFNSMLNKKNELEKRIETLNKSVQQDETVIQVLRLFSHVVPKSLSLVSLEYGPEKIPLKKRKNKNQEFSPKKLIQLSGISFKPQTDVKIYVAQLIMELEKSGYFSKVELKKEIFDEKGKAYMFELIGYFKETVRSPIIENKEMKNKR